MSSAGTAYIDIEARADGLAADIDAAVSSVDTQTIDVEAVADTASAQADIDAIEGGTADVTVDADTAPAEAEIDSVDGGEADIEVKANTDQAEEKIAELTESTSALGEAAQGALGGMGNLGGAASGAAGALGTTALAGAAAAAGLFEFAQGAIDAESAAQRFDLVTGNLADEMASIDVGGLSGDIGDLALQIGSSDEAMLNATASFASFAESTGASDDQIVEASDNINALALRAAALNPALGDAGAVAERLATALARGGRATTQYGIGLTSAEINARALADTGKDSTDQLTQFEKAAAGAAIAVERLGGSMGSDFQAGAQNARTEWERMTESIGEAGESVGGIMLPAIENITEAVGELADGIANLSPRDWLEGLWDLSGGLIANGFTDLWSAIEPGSEQLRGVGTVADDVAAAFGDTASAADEAEQQIADLGAEIDAYLSGLYDVPGAQRDAQQAIADLAAAMTDTEATWYDQAEAQEEVVRNTAEMIAVMNEQGATQPELDAAIANTIGMLRAERDAGHITEQQFQDLSTEIRNVPHKASTEVTAPGLLDVFHRTQDYRAEMNRVDATNPSSSFSSPGLASSLNDSIRYSAQISNLDGRTVTTYFKRVDFSAPLPKYAAGTESAAAGWAIVGENGPELVGFAGGERVLPAGQTAAAMERGGTPAPSIVVNVHGTATAADGQAVVDALRRWQLHNGPVPVKVSG